MWAHTLDFFFFFFFAHPFWQADGEGGAKTLLTFHLNVAAGHLAAVAGDRRAESRCRHICAWWRRPLG
jgi:hypothetical protein